MCVSHGNGNSKIGIAVVSNVRMTVVHPVTLAQATKHLNLLAIKCHLCSEHRYTAIQNTFALN